MERHTWIRKIERYARKGNFETPTTHPHLEKRIENTPHLQFLGSLQPPIHGRHMGDNKGQLSGKINK